MPWHWPDLLPTSVSTSVDDEVEIECFGRPAQLADDGTKFVHVVRMRAAQPVADRIRNALVVNRRVARNRRRPRDFVNDPAKETDCEITNDDRVLTRFVDPLFPRRPWIVGIPDLHWDEKEIDDHAWADKAGGDGATEGYGTAVAFRLLYRNGERRE